MQTAQTQLCGTIPWQPKLVEQMGKLLPALTSPSSPEESNFAASLKAFHAHYTAEPYRGRALLTYNHEASHYEARYSDLDVLTFGAEELLVMHSHREGKVGFPSIRDTYMAPQWSQLTPVKIIGSRFFPLDLSASFVFTRDRSDPENKYELSAYWRMRSTDTTGIRTNLVPIRQWSDIGLRDQIAMVTFTRWQQADAGAQLLYADTGLCFHYEARDRIWVSLTKLFNAIALQQPFIGAHIIFGRDAPDTYDPHEAIELPLSYRYRRWPAPRETYITIATPGDTLAIKPETLFAKQFPWQEHKLGCKPDSLFRNWVHTNGSEISYPGEQRRVRFANT